MTIFIKKIKMTLYEIISNLEQIALTQPNVRTADNGDIYDYMNANPSITYSVFFITHTNSRADEEYDYYTMNLFYIDRLTDDYNNRLQVQSIGRSVLDNIVRIFCDRYDVDYPSETNILFTPFTERFSDLTAGQYCTLTLAIPKTLICGDEGDNLPTIEINDNGSYIFGGYKIVVDVE